MRAARVGGTSTVLGLFWDYSSINRFEPACPIPFPSCFPAGSVWEARVGAGFIWELTRIAKQVAKTQNGDLEAEAVHRPCYQVTRKLKVSFSNPARSYNHGARGQIRAVPSDCFLNTSRSVPGRPSSESPAQHQ